MQLKNVLKIYTQQLNKLNCSQFSSISGNHYDVVISGAGPIGCGVACALQNEEYFRQTDEQNKILLVDIFEPPQLENVIHKPLPDHRVVSLADSSYRFLQSVGAWQHMDESRMGLSQHIQVWENDGQGFVQFTSNQYQKKNAEFFNRIVENNHIVGGLMKEINDNKFVDTSFKNSIEDFKRNPEKGNVIEIQMKNGETITTDLIVGSEGRNSKVKEVSKIPTYGWGYNQMGIVCSIKISMSENNQSFQRYFSSGPLAILPLWDDYCSIVWSVNTEDFDYLIKLPDIQFQNELNQALARPSKQHTPNFDINQDLFHYPPIVTEICNKRLAFPLAQLQSKKYVADGVALAGDAAHSVHPQAGQGMNNGFNDAAGLANNIITNLRSGNNIGQEISLKNYETEAKSWNYLTAFQMEAFNTIYSIQNPAFVLARNVGVNLLNNISPLKDFVVKAAATNPYAPKEFLWEQQQN